MEPRPSLPREVGTTLGGWLAGQLKISAILACIYVVGFAISGVPWWLGIGLAGGALQLVPMLGPFVTLLLATGVAYFGTNDIYPAAGALITFVIAQALEGFYLTPKILGSRLRLPPFVVFLAILAGGALFGVFGIIFAAPVVAVLAILWRRRRRV